MAARRTRPGRPDRRWLPVAIPGWIAWAVALHEWRGLPEVLDALVHLAATVVPPAPREFLGVRGARPAGLAAFAPVQWACLASRPLPAGAER